MLLRRERVVRVRVAELRHAADVAGVQPVDLDALLAARDREVAELLDDVARRVEHLLPGRDAPRENAEVGHVADVRLGVRLEHERGERRAVVGVDLDGLLAFGTLERVDLLHLERRRHELHDLGEERAHADHALARDAEQREQIRALHRLLHAADRLVAPDLGPFQIPLEQRVVGGADRLDQLLPVLVEARLRLGGDVDLVVLAALRPLLVDVGLLREEVHHAAEADPLA